MRSRTLLLPLLLSAPLAACEGGSGSPTEGGETRPPVVVQITSPAPGAVLGSYTADVAFTASSDTAVRVAFASVNGGAEQPMDGQVAPFPRPFNLALAAGENHIRIRVTDATGRDATAEVVVQARPAQLRYAVTPIGLVGGLPSEPVDVNESGQVVGYARTAELRKRAFFWSGGQMHDLHPATAFFSDARAINEAGDVLLHVLRDTPYCAGEVYLWRPAGSTRVADCGTPADVNDQGVVLLESDAGPLTFWQAGTVHTPPLQDGGYYPKLIPAGALNDHGEAVGTFRDGSIYTQAGYWDGSRLWKISTDGRTGHARDITNGGLVLGASYRPYWTGLPTATVLWDVRAQTTRIFFPFGSLSGGSGINEAGDMVGTTAYAAAAPRDGRAFVLRAGTAYEIVATDPGWTVTRATEINDRGQIVGMAVPAAGGPAVGVLLTPAP